MREELEKKLVSDYPDLFEDYGKSEMVTCMAFGCACGDGWEPILRGLCKTLAQCGRISLRRREFWRCLDPLKVKFHNLCRKVERWFKLPAHSLYNYSYPRYETFSGFKIKLAQVKEKFGTLRVYVDILNNYTEEDLVKFRKSDIDEQYQYVLGYVNGALSYADNLSETTCERCGEPGTLSTEGWWKTLCESCRTYKKDGKETIG